MNLPQFVNNGRNLIVRRWASLQLLSRTRLSSLSRDPALRTSAIALAVLGGLGLNFVLLRSFNTLNWPYLWPYPLLPILLGGIVLAVWFRDALTGAWPLRLAGVAMIFIGECYLLHSFDVLVQHFTLIALMHFVGVAGTFGVMIVNYLNQIRPRDHRVAPPLPADLPYVAALVPTYGEPIDILEGTVLSLQNLDYPADRLCIVISDDGWREEVRQLARRRGVEYQRGPRKDAKAGNLNSALGYLDDHHPQAELILTQDADEIIDPFFLQQTVGYFANPRLAFVQTPKEAITPRGDPFGNRDRVFYDTLQAGRNGSNAAFSCGSGVLWRLSAVKSIGGFDTWNLVEDMTTSYKLHAAGYDSEYHNQILSIGLSPDDIPGVLKQRGTWSADTWRMFLFDNPLRKAGLTLAQRLQYLELGLFYVTAAFFMPLLMLTPLLSLATGEFLPIQGAALFPWIAVSLLYYVTLSRGQVAYLLRMWQFWVGHWPTYTKAFWIALRSRRRKPSYKVTRKTRRKGFYGPLLWPQFLYVIVSVALIAHALFGMIEVDPAARLANIGVLLFFTYMTAGICRAAFYGLTARPLLDAAARAAQADGRRAFKQPYVSVLGDRS